MLWKLGRRSVSDLKIDGAYIICTIKESPHPAEVGARAIFQGNQLIALEERPSATSNAYNAYENALKKAEALLYSGV